MALVHADDFKGYGTAAVSKMKDGVYAAASGSTNPIADPDPNADAGSHAFVSSGGTTENLRYAYPSSVTTAGVALRVYCPSLPSSAGAAGRPISFRDVGNNTLYDIRIQTNGSLDVLNSAGTIIVSTTGPVISANAWWHIEAKLVISATVGSIEVRVEGVTVINETGLNTGTTSVAQYGNRNSGGAVTTFYIKDLVLWDGNGSQNNDFLGAVKVYEMLPASDVALNWTSTDANGYSVLDNDPPVDATNYISATYPAMPAAAEFSLTNLPADVTSVKGLITRVRATKSDGGDGQLQVSLTSAGSDDSGADRPITAAFTYWSDVSELDPDSGTEWTLTSANAATLKLDRTL